MNPFQIIFLPIVFFLFLRSLISLVRGSQPRKVMLLGTFIWLAAGIAIAWPDMTIRVAALLGIGRGADLILYLVAIAYMISMFYMYLRFRKVEANITEIVRQLAIRNVEEPDQTLRNQDLARNSPGG
jgi:hypothetical protein